MVLQACFADWGFFVDCTYTDLIYIYSCAIQIQSGFWKEVGKLAKSKQKRAANDVPSPAYNFVLNKK